MIGNLTKAGTSTIEYLMNMSGFEAMLFRPLMRAWSWSETQDFKWAHCITKKFVCKKKNICSCVCVHAPHVVEPHPELPTSTEIRKSSSNANHLHRPPLLPFLCGSSLHCCIHMLEVWGYEWLWSKKIIIIYLHTCLKTFNKFIISSDT